MKDENINNEEEIIDNISSNENFADIDIIPENDDSSDISIKDRSKKNIEELKICRKEKEEYLTGWQRAKADYINLQKEMEINRINISLLTKERILESLLPTLDSFDMAFSNKESWENVDLNWRKGIEFIHSQFINSLLDIGVDIINKEMIPFDPSLHESISIVNTEDPSKNHKVEKIIQVGYKIGSRVVRPARVNIYEIKNS